jgi:hypothetical protein
MAFSRLIGVIAGTAVLVCTQALAQSSARVDMKRLLGADKEAGQWMSHSRTFDEQYFSPLKQITDQNVSKLGLAWFVDLPTNQNVESSPLMIDGGLSPRPGARCWPWTPGPASNCGHTIPRWREPEHQPVLRRGQSRAAA